MSNIDNVLLWVAFSIFVIIALSLDIFLIGRKKVPGPHTSIKASLVWTIIWITCALLFNLALWFFLYETTNPTYAHQKALDFFTGYLIEKSLALDNLFAFYMVFTQLRIPHTYQHRVFIYGIMGAIVLRLMIILFGTYLISRFHWILYVLGAFLIITGIQMFFFKKDDDDLTNSKIFNFLQKHLRVTDELKGHQFFIKRNHLIYATRLFIALILIEISDIIFAFDSIPAIFAITTDPFIVWTSNIFAILGLRALYFLLAGMVDRFYLLKFGIALILIFVGIKLVIEPWFDISTLVSLFVISCILITFIFISIIQNRKQLR